MKRNSPFLVIFPACNKSNSEFKCLWVDLWHLWQSPHKNVVFIGSKHFLSSTFINRTVPPLSPSGFSTVVESSCKSLIVSISVCEGAAKKLWSHPGLRSLERFPALCWNDSSKRSGCSERKCVCMCAGWGIKGAPGT